MSQNGRLRASELAPIIGGGQLAKPAAQSWNAFARMMKTEHGFDVHVNDSYRPLGQPGDLARGVWSQQAAWERYRQGGNLAARPGTSNHGLGMALDLAPDTIAAVAAHGDRFGWNHAHTDAPSESWHHLWLDSQTDHKLVARWTSVQPGDTLHPGDTGSGILALKHRLQVWGAWPRLWPVNNKYAGRTILAVKAFQKAHHLHADGIVGPTTWRALNSTPAGPARKPIVKPKPAAPKTFPKFADIFADDAFDAKAYKAAGHTLISMKASEGHDFTDSKVAENAAAARSVGLDVHFYHFARPSNNAPEAEAEHFATVAKSLVVGVHDRLCLDWEDPKWDAHPGAANWIMRFSQTIGKHGLTLRILYSGGPYLDSGDVKVMPVDHTQKPLRFWLAAYASNPERYCPSWARKALWAVQFTDKEKVAGIGNPSDYSYLK
jgi:GH25 family lysozyme M1 (1,4-beta-N-acetylmuramidase)